MFVRCFKQEAIRLPNLQNGGWKPGPCFVPPLLSHTSATWPPAKGVAGPLQHPRASNSFLSVSQLTFLTSWVGWLENPRDPHVIASPALGLQLHITMPGFRFLTWVLEVKCKSPYLQGKHLIHRAISPVPDTIFSLNLALVTTETNYMIF